MLIEINIAELLIRQPDAAVVHVIAEFLGTKPPEHFLARHSEKIAADEIEFLTQYLSQWPGRLRSTISHNRTGKTAMVEVEKIISVGFLMAVPEMQFLEITYREFFDRAVDNFGQDAYGALDFADARNRETVIDALASSNEFRTKAQLRLVAAPSRMAERLPVDDVQGLYWDRRAALADRWFSESNSRLVTQRYTPLLLWVADRKTLYTFLGMEMSGTATGNILSANPEWAIWGPKINLASGDYRIRVDLVSSAESLFLLDISAESGTQTLAKIQFFGSLKWECPVTLSRETRDFEVRLFNYTGKIVDITINEISIG